MRVALTLLLIATLAAAGARQLAGHTGRDVLVERSDSMSPRFGHGDLLVSRRVSASAIRPGQVVTFSDPERGGRLVTHRAVAVARRGPVLGFVTRGDATDRPERWSIPADGRVGRLEAALPKAGYAVAALSDRTVRLVLIAFGAAVLAGALVRDLRRR